MNIQSYHIPSNFTDAGKILGAFVVRNVVESVILVVPIAFLCFAYLPLEITAKIIVSLIIVVPVGGFSLIGINDDSITVFIKTWIAFKRQKGVISYRGTPVNKKRGGKRSGH